MKSRDTGHPGILLVLFCAAACAVAATAAQAETLWEIGKADNDTGEFAFAPKDFAKCAQDAAFVIGKSDPAKDWPYAHPGPVDAWAGSRQHEFIIVFGTQKAGQQGECRLLMDIVDSHSGQPPRLSISLNGHEVQHQVPRGASDASINGDPAAGKESRFEITFPANALRAGTNVLSIKTLSGSWVLYDYLRFEAPPGTALTPVETAALVQDVTSPPVLVERDGGLRQLIQVRLRSLAGSTKAKVRVGKGAPLSITVQEGPQQIELPIPPVDTETTVPVEVAFANQPSKTYEVAVKPVRKWEVYLLHHTHLDIGYTHLQTDVEKKQWEFLDRAMELGRKTEGYPEGSRFKWLPEGLWAVDSYLANASEEKRAAFVDAVNNGWISLDALYGNELTALCRPEELLELTGYARRLSARYGIPIDTAMITDVPGYTWGLVPVLAQSGLKYLSIGPNATWRIGYTLSEWGDRPFYWTSPSGEEKVLAWVAGKAYSWFHRAPLREEECIFAYLRELQASGYPYDMVQVRYNIGGDNGPPDPELPDFVRNWNAKYAYPKLVIATTREMFQEFEKRYAKIIPTQTGDFTPYWEDGAASSARETALNREAAERLVQAQTLWAMLHVPEEYPAEDFQAAWRDIILYDEHTWGAHNSISEPESDFAKGQWAIKQAFALEGARKTEALLAKALEGKQASGTVESVHVLNTSSWPRTDLVTIPADWKLTGSKVIDTAGNALPSQHLSTGELVFVAKDVPAMGGTRYVFKPGEASGAGQAMARDFQLSNGMITLRIDEDTGDIASLKAQGMEGDLVDPAGPTGLNGYLYVEGRDPKKPKRSGEAKVSVKERGPVLASLLITSDAPGCRALTREVRMIDGLDRLEIINTLDKELIYKQEAVHLAFPFNVPDAEVRMDTPWAVVRAETDQLAGACKNYFTVQRWADVSNAEYGVTWATVDAPLIEIGAITTDPLAVGWLKEIAPSPTLYSYVMNNYWETNYKAGQEGPTVFRYALCPHGRFDATQAARFGTAQSQPLIPVAAPVDAVAPSPPVHITGEGVVATTLKPSDDGKALILRLFGASGKPQRVHVTCPGRQCHVSDVSEAEGSVATGPIQVPAYGIITLRISKS